MLKALTVLLAFQTAGELLHLWWLAAIPGPVLGLLLLLGWCTWRRGVPGYLDHTAQVFSSNLGILFVPVAVGVVVFLPALWPVAGPLMLVLVGSVLATLVAVAWVLNALAHRVEREDEQP